MKKAYWWRICLVLALAFNIQSASAQQNVATTMAVTPITDDVVLTKDRFENFNRGAYQFNDGWDQVAFRPIAKAYQKIVPEDPRGCVHGIFENLSMPYTALNNILQGKFKAAGQDLCRFVVNSTIGLGGCIDVASKWNIPKHDEDFGQTLGVWGVPSGPFIMLPGLGPSTVRDALAKAVDSLADPIGYIQAIKVRNSVRGLRFVDARTKLLDTMDFANDVAFDKYALLRDAWMQRREAQVRDEDYEPDVAPLANGEAAKTAMSNAPPPVEVVAPVDTTPEAEKIDVLAPFNVDAASTVAAVVQ
jgi:phospholipid-binding lipoprotein MlaA